MCTKKYKKTKKKQKKNNTKWKYWWSFICLLVISDGFEFKIKTGRERTEWRNEGRNKKGIMKEGRIMNEIKINRGTDTFEVDGWISYDFQKDGNWVTWTSREGWLSSRRRNIHIRTINGNRGNVKQTIRLYHWNVGNGWWTSKLNEISALLIQKDPDILVLSEANLKTEVPREQQEFEGYETVLPSTMMTQGYARLVILVKEGIIFEKMENCMDDGAAVVWIRVTIRGNRKINIGGVYRDHKLLLQPLPNMSGDPQLQKLRWNKVIKGWTRAARGNNCIMIGDTNLDFCKWDQPEPIILNLVNEVKQEIETLGFAQMIGSPTRAWPGQPVSLVDHIWVNNPGGILTTSNEVRGPWDHNLIGAVIRTKNRTEQEHEINKRNRKNFNLERYREKIKNIDWTEFYGCNEINLANSIFEEKIGNILEEEAPLKFVQIRRKKPKLDLRRIKK